MDMQACTKTAQALCVDELLTNAAADKAAAAASAAGNSKVDSKLAMMSTAASTAARVKAAKDRVVRCLADTSMEAVASAAAAQGEPACADEVFREVREQSEDIRFAPGTNAACEGDMARLCADVKPGRGRVRASVRACVRTCAPIHAIAGVWIRVVGGQVLSCM